MSSILPVTKLFSLLVKTLAKPASKQIKTYVSKHPFSKKIVLKIGQFTHISSSRLPNLTSPLKYKVYNITPLEESKALSLGSDFIGEFFIFSVGTSLLVYEYQNKSKKDKLKEQKRLEDLQWNRDTLNEL